MKKSFKLLLALMLAVVFVLSAAACELRPAPVEGEKTITVAIDMTAYTGNVELTGYTDKIKVLTLTTTENYLSDALAALQEDGKLTVVTSESTYGLSLDGIDGVAVSNQTEYFSAYSNDTENTGIISWDGTFGGVTFLETYLGYNMFGISSMPLKDGKIYLFVYTSF